MKEERLAGGVANVGAVTRIGDTVRRPAPANAQSIHRLLEHLAARGFEAPRPVSLDPDYETLTFVVGDVPISPHPAWALTDEALESVGNLLRRFHDATSSFEVEDTEWSVELRDPLGDDLICHNDVCLENVVFRDGRAVALLDFDFAAPARAIWDVAMTASMCVPIRPPEDPLPGQGAFDPFHRLGVFVRAYGMEASQAQELVDALIEVKRMGRAFVQRHLDAGHEGFTEMIAERPANAYENLTRWLHENKDRLVGAILEALEKEDGELG